MRRITHLHSSAHFTIPLRVKPLVPTRKHKFQNSFQDSLNPFRNCGKAEIGTSSHYLFHCSKYSEELMSLLNAILDNAISLQ